MLGNSISAYSRTAVIKQGPTRSGRFYPPGHGGLYTLSDAIREALNISDILHVYILHTGSSAIKECSSWNDIDVVVFCEKSEWNNFRFALVDNGFTLHDNYNDGPYEQATFKKYNEVYKRDLNIILLNEMEWFTLWSKATQVAQYLGLSDKKERGRVFRLIVGH